MATVQIASQMNPTLAKKLKKVLETPVDQPELVSALTALSGFYTSNTLAARRGLRADIERRSVTINQRLIESFEPVESTFLELEGDVDALLDSCKSIQERLKASQNLTEQLKQEVAAKTEVTEEFFSKVFLQPEAAQALEAGPQEPQFFEALSQLQGIQAQCQTLLREHHQKVGLEIMDKMAMQLEAAYERLYRWVQSQCQGLDAGDSSDIDLRLQRSLAALQDRAVLFKFCIEEIASMRKALAGEKDLLDALLRPAAEGEPTAAGGIHLTEVLPAIVDALVQPFTVRLEQALTSQPGVLLAYKLANLVDFYIHSIGGILQLTGPSPLTGAKEKCTQHFLRHNEVLMDKMLRSPPTVSPELLPPHSVTEGITRFGTILQVYDTSLVPEQGREADFAPVCTAALDPLLRVCTLAAQGRSPTDVSVFLINVLSAVLAVVGGRAYMRGRVAQLQAELERHEATVVDDQSAGLLQKCGMAERLALIQAAPKGTHLADQPGLDAGGLMESVRKLYAALFGANAMVLPQCDRIQIPQHRIQTRQAILDRLVDVYRMLYEAVCDPASGYSDPAIIVPHNPQQFVTLLECQ